MAQILVRCIDVTAYCLILIFWGLQNFMIHLEYCFKSSQKFDKN